MVDLLGEAEGGWFWCAHDEVLHRPVAVHLMGVDDPRAPVLMDAARRAAVLDDRRNLRVLDADTIDHVAFVVNEWGQGESLDLLLANGPMSPQQSAWLVAEVADTIAKAHAAGVSHDHLLPEHVLLDENGEVRVIGLAVDAALHGVPTHQPDEDVTHLASLLYACLTSKWPGPGASQVAPAPTEHGKVLRPRQVRAGIPRELDRICDEMLLGGHHSRSLGLSGMLGHRAEHDLTTPAGVRDALHAFLGDPAAVAPELGERPLHGRRPQMPPVTPPDRPWPHGTPTTPAGGTAAEGSPAHAGRPANDHPRVDGEATAATSITPSDLSRTGTRRAGVSDPVEVPTEAGMPVFHDGESDDVEWMRARANKPAPPPEFEQPKERPLFAPEPPDGSPARRPRTSATPPPRPHDDYWPWDTSSPSSLTGSGVLPPVQEPVPGRNWMRLAWLVGFAALVLLAVTAAYQLGLGANDDPPSEETPAGTDGSSPGPATPLEVTARDFDPQGEPPEEYPDDVPLALDGDPTTAWGTQTYVQQFGPQGLKSGVGLLLDLGGEKTVREVRVTVLGGDTAAQVYVTEGEPESVDGLEPVDAAAGEGQLTIVLNQPTLGDHVVVWLTRVPATEGGFRGQIAEVEVLE